jgi:hypothetical protein
MNKLVPLASTFVLLGLAASGQQGTTQEPQQRLARARLIEQQEGDLASAQAAYRALLDDASATAVHGEAALRLGTLLWRLDQQDVAKPVLARAVAAGGAIAAEANAVLAGQGEQGKLAAERLAKARALVARAVELLGPKAITTTNAESETAPMLRDLGQQLTWLGEQGALALVEQLDRSLRAPEVDVTPDGKAVRREPPSTHERLASWLWAIGTKPAAEFLQRVAADPDVAHRRTITAPLAHGATQVAADLTPALLQFGRDADLTGEVARNVELALSQLPPDVLLAMIADADAEARASGLAALARTWEGLDATERQRALDARTAIERARRSGHARESRAAWQLLSRFAVSGPPAVRAMFLAAAADAPPTLDKLQLRSRVRGDDELLTQLAAAATALGPFPRPGHEPAKAFVTNVIVNTDPEWSPAAEESAITLLELGYADTNDQLDRWMQRTIRLATAEQLPRLVRALPTVGRPDPAITELLARDAGAAVFPALRDLAESALADAIPRWRDELKPTWREHRLGDRTVREVQPSRTMTSLLAATVYAGAGDGARWATDVVRRRPELANLMVQLLGHSSRRGVAEARESLRTLMVWPGTESDAVLPQYRAQTFAELARAGDVAAIPLFPRAYELGLERITAVSAERQATGIGIAFLAEHRQQQGSRRLEPWHGYRDEDLVTAWRTLLDSNAADAVWAELTTGAVRGQPHPNTQPTARSFELPNAVMPLVAERLLTRWAGADEREREALREHLPRAFQSVRRDDVVGDTPLARALRALLRAEDTTLAFGVFQQLPRDVAAAFADDARAALRRAPGTHKSYATFLLRQGVELSADEWRELLTTVRSSYPLRELLQLIPPAHAASLRPQVEALLDDPARDVAIAAVAAMRRLYGADAVAALLPQLQHEDEDVRKAARTALDQLREEHERRAFWTQAGSGIDTRPQSAAAKLLAQAQVGQPKEQRVLALRSLAVLGAPEALPYLIDHTKDADADVAAAARAAVAQIHAKAGTPPTADDKK